MDLSIETFTIDGSIQLMLVRLRFAPKIVKKPIKGATVSRWDSKIFLGLLITNNFSFMTFFENVYFLKYLIKSDHLFNLNRL